ncbi:DUF2971 domain-containing protein [Devosia sp. MC1541]|uniref:DUF2971 domain-containing protein n=1 Tax=Devosia sp. MC1541 TaxID=2725264 RepID=UPI00145F8EAE|nr:DUF2971 domain-containing protein [Devosia sp. MC1541]
MVDIDALQRIFAFQAVDRRQKAITSGVQFVHYTSAEAALQILRNESVWLRKSAVMNDFSEIEYGNRLLVAAWHSDAGTKLKNILDRDFDGSAAWVAADLDAAVRKMRLDTYMVCISEHRKFENGLGRLSMWRAYGNVAIVVQPTAFMENANPPLPLYSLPVSYLDPMGFQKNFQKFVYRFMSALPELRKLQIAAVREWLSRCFRQFILGTKHKGFREEREWRVIYSPESPSSPLISKNVEVVRGVVQPVIKLDLRDAPDLGIRGLAVKDFVEKIIIGPTAFPLVQSEAFATVLEAKGVPDPLSRIEISDIPLRQ